MNFSILSDLEKLPDLYVMFCTIWYHLYNLKTVKNTNGAIVTFSFRVFKLYKWYQIAQRITYSNAKEKEFPESLPVTTLN